MPVRVKDAREVPQRGLETVNVAHKLNDERRRLRKHRDRKMQVQTYIVKRVTTCQGKHVQMHEHMPIIKQRQTFRGARSSRIAVQIQRMTTEIE